MTRLGLMLVGISMAVNLSLSTATAKGWAVWKHNSTRPGAVAVAPVGSLSKPWNIDSIWHNDTRGAWKKACWLARNGDLLGRRYSSPDMRLGRVSCDTNCNCRF